MNYGRDYNREGLPRYDSIYKRPPEEVEDDLRPSPQKNHPKQGRLFDDDYPSWRDDYRKHYTDRKTSERNAELAGRWRELTALWEAVKEMDMEDAAEMIYDLVRETMERSGDES